MGVWGVLLPGADLVAAAEVPRAARRAEELGFDVVWAADDCVGAGVDAPVSLAAAAAATTRIGLGLGIASGRRTAAWSAKHLTAVDALAPGRLTLGLDLGAEAGGPPTDGAELIALALGCPVPSDDPELAPAVVAPALATAPPVACGGSGEPALRRAAAMADTWLAGDLTPAGFAAAAGTLHELARESDRATPRTGVLLRERGTATGTVLDRIVGAVEEISAYTAIGAEAFVLVPTGPDPLADYERFAALRDRVAAELPA